MKHDIYEYDTSGQGKWDPKWYATVWASGTMLKLQVKGMPHNTHFNMDKRAIPQLIDALRKIQNESS